MNPFEYRNGELHVEDVRLSQIADQVGTPTYVYSRQALLDVYQRYVDALGDHPGTVCYAVKANSNLAVLNLLAEAGAGFDIVSGGELERVLKAGGKPEKIIFSGVGKTRDEIRRALEVGIACFNVESISEIDHLAEVAAECSKIAPISLRVNPDVDAKTHPYISTGLKQNKFGIGIQVAEEAYLYANSLPSLSVKGIDCHIGSQLTDVSPLLEACDRLLELHDRLVQQGIAISHLDLGGGIGVVYRDETLPSIADYFAQVKEKFGDRQLAIFCEPGRSIAANAGVLLTHVEYLKMTRHKNFAVVDAAMNDLLRPALYQAWQNIQPVLQAADDAEVKSWDIVGPVCESADFLGHDRELALQEGDLLAVMSAGAYGFVMSSNYNTRGRAAEVMVSGSRFQVVRQRESFADMIRGESVFAG
ncbi:diaminopimelate decarboxylase [Proteobacteria bacterium 005FR1]|nr:diaminopimelate decarboxylase [Proteobacteria bacterium 005FR1]